MRSVTRAATTALLLLTAVPSLARTEGEDVRCARRLLSMLSRRQADHRLGRTLGVEWEFSPVRSELAREGLDADRSFLMSLGAFERELAGSRFRELFAFHGRDSRGEWVRDLIPAEVVRSKAFERLRQIPGVRFEVRAGETYLASYSGLPADSFIRLLRGLMEAKGKNGGSLALRKVRDVWKDKQGRLDRLIPEEVAEEWRGEAFVGIEFPTTGPVARASDLRDYLRNLWVRLGLFETGAADLERALDRAVGHVHWVADIRGLPQSVRQRAYQGVIGRWGDANDWSNVEHMDAYRRVAAPDGAVELDKNRVGSLWDGLRESLRQYSIAPLTNDVYDRVSATSGGVVVRERSRDLRPDVDPNLPPAFKRLHFGLRGIYGQGTVPEGEAVPVVGIEARNRPTVGDNLAALPAKVPGKPETDLRKLLEHASGEGRGMEGSVQGLKERASAHGVDPALVDDVTSLASKEGYAWTPEQVRAQFLLPLNDWLSHPSVRRNLARLSASESRAAVLRYHQAFARYRKRVNDLAHARKHPRYRYRPDWKTPIQEFPDGINRVYPRAEFPEIGRAGDWSSRPDQWFQAILASEAARFVREADLATLLRLP